MDPSQYVKMNNNFEIFAYPIEILHWRCDMISELLSNYCRDNGSIGR